MPKVKLVIALGNPDEKYQKTYHNVGFLTLDYLAENAQIPTAIKSDVYMNESGVFVKKALKKYKIKSAELMIIHDDADIEIGKYKISFGRGSAGHKGVQSIIDSLGAKNFWRLRIGIAKKLKRKAGDIVLKKISQTDWKILNEVCQNLKLSF